MIQIKDVTKLYPATGNGSGRDQANGAVHALDHISLHVAEGEWLSIMGPSGSGKSTLVNLIPFLTAVENVMLAQYFHSMTDEREAVDALARVGLADRAHHLPSQLSGGE